MSTILLADDSTHALRMGEHILREEGFLIATALDAASALAQVVESDPDLVIADAFLPGRDGYQLCEQLKRWRPHIRVILTAGFLETIDEDRARQVGCNGVLRKPFEASVAIALIRPLVQEAILERGLLGEKVAPISALAIPVSDALFGPPKPPDPEKVQAAVMEALEAAMPDLVRDITERVLIALGH
ncbi:MAG: response regulator [Acidobacteriota bacterium]